MTSARSSSAATASSASARAPSFRARSSPCASVRFATTAISAPRETEVAGSGLADLPGAEQEDAVACEVAEHLLGQRCGRRRDRRRALADRGLHPNALARVQRLAEEPVEKRACRPGFECRRTWPRISPSPGTSESSPAATRKRWSAAASSRRRYSAAARSSARSPASCASAATASSSACSSRDEIELGAVAGREHDGLAVEPLGERAAGVEIERDPLAQLDRSAVVRDAGEGSAAVMRRSGSEGGRSRRARSPRG